MDMADVRGSSASACDDKCGCPSPCPGGISCKCGRVGGDERSMLEHKRCPCGEHCGCNPCTCPNSETATGKSNCKCGPACTCPTCAA